VDDLFVRLLEELAARGALENTVIIGVTDHYTYGFKDMETLMDVSDVEETIWLERTPCFIWTPGLEPTVVEKTLNTADLLPTVLNLLGVESPYRYMGQDAFDDRYMGYALFPNGSWVCDGVAYSTANHKTFILEEGKTATAERMQEMANYCYDFARINNLILETDYYASK
jgi:arylsulfatase A-like enzyme